MKGNFEIKSHFKKKKKPKKQKTYNPTTIFVSISGKQEKMLWHSIAVK